MSLVPTKYTSYKIETPKPYPYTQAQDHILIETGFYVDPATDKEIVIEKIVQSLSWYGRVMHREEEYWSYDYAGSPPTSYVRNTYARSYLPKLNPGRAYKLMETETAVFFPWNSIQPGFPNLSSRREVSGYVLYDLHQERETLSTEAKDKLQERDQDDGTGSEGNPVGNPKLVIDSARTWREAADEAGIIEKTGSPQTTIWVEPFRVVSEITYEELDKFLTYRIIDDRIRPGAPKTEGPEVRKKESFRYRLPVPVEPPTIEANLVESEVRLEVTGGGATIGDFRAVPTSYRILRRIAAGGDRGSSPDPFDRYLDDPPTAPRRTVIITTNVGGLDGTPRSPLPTQTDLDEPGDTDEPTPDGWTVIATPDNERAAGEEGFAAVVDTDLTNGTTYEYAATALVNRDESIPSDSVKVAYDQGSHSSRIKVRTRRDEDGVLEVDVVAPDDPTFPDYGETIELESPVAVYEETAEEFGEEIGARLFGKTREPKLKLAIRVNVPLITIERGQSVRLSVVQWKTTGNELVIDSETEADPWLVDGFRLRARRNSAGDLVDYGGTELDLVEP